MSYTIINDNNITHLKTIKDDTIDSIITDPPYGIEFLGKDWDKNTGAIETWQECLRVLKPGGYLLAFSAARTYHNLATNIESVGFEIRDQLMWLYSSGFPKAQDIGKSIQRRQGVEQTKEKELVEQGGFNNWANTQENKNVKRNNETINEIIPTSAEAQQWAGWKTALKPSHEPIVMARKPFKGSTIDNVLTHGVGALNIDASRIEWAEGKAIQHGKVGTKATFNDSLAEAKGVERNKFNKDEEEWKGNEQGRFPSNVIGEVAEHYQKYFYCPKVSRRERHVGFEQPTDDFTTIGNKLDVIRHRDNMVLGYKKHNIKKDPLAHIPSTTGGMWDTDGSGTQYNRASIDKKPSMNKNKDPLAHIDVVNQGKADGGLIGPDGKMNHHRSSQIQVGNNHPTVKPVALMRYLIKLVTPTNSHVLDPFCGSGSTGMAAVELGHTFTGIEMDANYVSIAKRRIEGWNKPQETGNTYNELFEENK
jgi:site-specific DNA-methyltransferase (adenine-specific)